MLDVALQNTAVVIANKGCKNMRNVRIFYKKTGRMKFMSHLDMNRYITRLIKKSRIPIWFTEGFNCHAYITFALPLSLGMTCDYDSVDIRVIDDSFSNEMIKTALDNHVTDGMEVISVCEPFMKPADIAFAEYELHFEDKKDTLNKIKVFFEQDSIFVQKKGKKGKVSEIELISKIKSLNIDFNDDCLKINIILPAGNNENINPNLFVDKFRSEIGNIEVYEINRKMLYNEKMEKFK